MQYFHGFSLQNEELFFKPYLINSDYCVAGFSYGAQQAIEYVYHTKKRVDRLILLSPAFFQEQKASFVRTQLRYFEADKDSYIQQFISNVSYPSSIDLSEYLDEGSKEELDSLLNYVWDRDKIETIRNRGTSIEVFLGAEDKIIDSKSAFDFFSSLTTTYLLKDHGHLLAAY
ncbi:MAG: pimelyl-ACP methyl ester esterase BioV [Campylobacterota bacterium]|nr:pimelyl-ACP methyl ester esterase BioV [Campylobacterota bacterium]